MTRLSMGSRSCAAVAILAVTALGVTDAIANAASLLPKVPTSFQTSAHDLAIAPQSVLVSQDGNASVWGPGSRGFRGENNFPREPAISWTQWGGKVALATGSLIQGNCTPSCAEGTFTAYPVSIKMWRPDVLHGERIFTRFSFTFTYRRPSTMSRTVVASATYSPATTAYGGSPAYWGWDPKF
jgi:hypothetical protein